MKTNLDDLFSGLEFDDSSSETPRLRLTDAEPVAAPSDIADTVIEDAGPLLRLTTHDMVALLDARTGDEETGCHGQRSEVGRAESSVSAPEQLPDWHGRLRSRTRSAVRGTQMDGVPSETAPFIDSPFVRPTVLHVRVVSGTGGGPEKTILRSPRYANDEYFRMAVAYIHPKGDPGIDTIKAKAKEWNAPLITIPERGPLDVRTVAALYRICKERKVAIWHGHDYKSNLLGIILRRFWKMKLVTTVHGWTHDTWRTRAYYHVDKWCLRRYDEVIAVSPLLHEQCLNIGVKPQKLTYIANAIDCGEFKRTRSIRQARSELSIYRSATIMGVVGRLSPEKGVDRAIESVASLHTKYPGLELHIVGDGPEYEKLKRLAIDRGVAGIVHFWGYQSDTRRFFEMFDFLLLPSRTEGFPNVVLEALALGVPVAAADVGGVSELLKHGRRGVVLDPTKQETWADQIAPLIVSADRRKEFSRLGRMRVEKYYSFDKRMAKVFDVYDRVLSIAPRTEDTRWRRAA